MKLAKVLDELNSLEKNSFIKIIDNLLIDKNINLKEINDILNTSDGQLKSVDNLNVSKIFGKIKEHYRDHVSHNLVYSNSLINLAIDIIIRDGNCIMSREWFSKLFEQELKELKKKVKEFKSIIDDPENSRSRDYKIYYECVHTAFYNDLEDNREPQITSDEKSILITLSNQLELSAEEVRLIEAQIVVIPDFDLEDMIRGLRDLGCFFYSKKNLMIYIPDEIVKGLRLVKNKRIADKHFRRVLGRLKDAHINLIARKHNIERTLNREEKIRSIINQGIRFQEVLSVDIFKIDTNATEKKKFLNDFISKDLKISFDSKGITVGDKIDMLIKFFNELDEDTKVGISIEGYDSLLADLSNSFSKLNTLVKKEFELQSNDVLKSDYLLDYNIKPRDILELIADGDIKKICEKLGVKTRGDQVQNLLDAYKDTENILIESYCLLADRDFKGLQENGVHIKEAEIGLKFEEITKEIFDRLGLVTNEEIRKNVSNAKNKIDIIISTAENEVIVVECKTSKDKGYNKFSSVTRQVKAYQELLVNKGYRVIKSLIIANDFSDDFVNECELEMTLNISLIKARSLLNIYDSFKDIARKEFPVNLLMRDVVINDDRVIKALKR